MRDNTISIDFSDALSEAEMQSAYIGALTTAEGDTLDRMALTTERRELSARFRDEAVADICRSLSECLESCEGDTLTLRLPPLWNNATEDALRRAVKSAITLGVLARWFVVADKTEAENYTALAARDLEKAQILMQTRMRPRRKVWHESL